MHWHSLQTLASWKGEVVNLMIKAPNQTNITPQSLCSEPRLSNATYISHDNILNNVFFLPNRFLNALQKK